MHAPGLRPFARELIDAMFCPLLTSSNADESTTPPQHKASEASANPRIYELDALRAMAAVNLVLFHFTHVYAVKFGYTEPLGGEWPFGAYGVMMFFILSGFVNSMSLLRRRQPTAFVAARLVRIVPLYLIAVVANLAISHMAPFNGATITLAQFAANLTLMPQVFGHECMDPVMWTLQVEMIFYALLVGLFRYGGLRNYWRGWGAILLGSLVLCPTLDAAATTQGETAWFAVANGLRHLLVLDFAPLFAIGFLLYMIKTKVGKLSHNILGVVGAASVFHMIDHGKHNPIATALIIGLVTLAAYGRLPLLRLRPIVYISTISYALYLCHNNLGCVLIHTFDHAGVPPLACLAIVIAFSFAVAILVTQRIEQPLTRWLRNAYESRRLTAAQ